MTSQATYSSFIRNEEGNAIFFCTPLKHGNKHYQNERLDRTIVRLLARVRVTHEEYEN